MMRTRRIAHPARAVVRLCSWTAQPTARTLSPYARSTIPQTVRLCGSRCAMAHVTRERVACLRRRTFPACRILNRTTAQPHTERTVAPPAPRWRATYSGEGPGMKPTIRLSFPHKNRASGKDEDRLYKVEQAIGTIDYVPGQLLQREAVKRICELGGLKVVVSAPPKRLRAPKRRMNRWGYNPHEPHD